MNDRMEMPILFDAARTPRLRRRDVPSRHSPNPFSVNGVSGEAVTVKKPAASDGFFTFLKVTVPVLSQSTSLLFASRDLSIVTSVTAADVKSV